MATTSRPIGEGGTLDFGQAFKFFFEDPDWVRKLLMGSLFQILTLVLVGIPFTLGYALRVLARTSRGEPRPLPEWDDLGGLFGEGLRGFGLSLVHLAAGLLIPGGLGCLFAIMGGVLSSGGRQTSDAAAATTGLGLMFCYGLALLVMLVLGIYLPAAMARMVVFDRFGAGLEFGENIAFIRRNLTNYLLTLAIQLLTNFIAQISCYLLCLPLFPTSFWAVCTFTWALGETVRRDPALAPAAAPLATY